MCIDFKNNIFNKLNGWTSFFFYFVAAWLSFGVGPDCEQWPAFFRSLSALWADLPHYYDFTIFFEWLGHWLIGFDKVWANFVFFSRLARFDPTRGFPISMLVRVLWKSIRYYDKLVYSIPVDDGTGNRIWISISKNLRCIVIAMIHNWYRWTDALVGILKGKSIIN